VTTSPERASIKPHRSSEELNLIIHRLPVPLGPKDFKLMKQIGSGDIGTVYLCHFRDESNCYYAMKVVDKLALAKKRKLERAATEKRILKLLDHPFLPSLYADFDAAPHYSCVVMEFCSGGDLHSLRHCEPGLCFPVAAAR
jgi:protein-serine/threonine kinase